MSTRDTSMAEGLRSLSWPLSQEMFLAVLALVPTVAVEVVIFTREEHIVLLPRPDNDPFFSGKVHIPGSIVRRGDTEENTLARAVREIGLPVSPAKFVDRVHVPMGTGPLENPRGQEIGLVFTASLVVPTPVDLMTADPWDLPANMIEFQREMVARAAVFHRAR